ncbi:MAG TPA: TIGR03084 family metal-binding protein [Jatrophihabitantaceae bacterium]|nr:TIGR03084 family metal-binding protein [Jatrophihabitantaceae bacterium]
MADLVRVLADLQAESEDLDALVSVLSEDAWATPTPATGWTIAHQIGHLAWTDQAATLAATDPDGFRAAMQAAFTASHTFVDEAAEERAHRPPGELLASWREGRAALAAELLGADRGKIVWFGPSMSATSMATARLMETWAHGQDVADALGLLRLPTPRLRHVAHIGARTRDFAYLVRDRVAPREPFRIELTAPDGAIWVWGDEDGVTQSVTGPALDFCLLVTQRRHRADLSLVATGADADEWLDIAQAFAGPPGSGRTPGQFSR